MKLAPASVSALVRGDVVNAFIEMQTGRTEEQKRRSQLWLSKANVLPKLIDGGGIDNGALEREWGVKFIGEVDDLFARVILPPGWLIIPYDVNAYWSHLVDDTGAKRAAVYFKSTSYDRRAQMALVSRYVNHSRYTGKEEHIDILDQKTNQIIYEAGLCSVHDFKCASTLYEDADRWLLEHFPNHKDKFAYWKE